MSQVAGEERVYFMFCSGLRLAGHPRAGSQAVFSIPDSIDSKKLIAKDKVALKKSQQCQNCHEMHNPE
jgi:hypothetical protein